MGGLQCLLLHLLCLLQALVPHPVRQLPNVIFVTLVRARLASLELTLRLDLARLVGLNRQMEAPAAQTAQTLAAGTQHIWLCRLRVSPCPPRQRNTSCLFFCGFPIVYNHTHNFAWP